MVARWRAGDEWRFGGTDVGAAASTGPDAAQHTSPSAVGTAGVLAMRRLLIAMFGLLALAPAAQACINASGTDHTGRKFNPGWYLGEELEQTLNWGPKYYARSSSDIIHAARARPNYDTLTDLGVLLVYQRQYALAVRHFLMIEQRYPGRYGTAANLGTALELSGHDAPALAWIRIGIQRNRDAHDGTEWLHARILEAKQAMARDPNYLAAHSITGLAFEPVKVPPLPAMPRGNDGRVLAPWQVNEALNYQLRERLQFVPPKDAVVANLMQDWATLNLAGGPIENADLQYDLAIRYGATRTPLMQERKAFIRQTLARVGTEYVDKDDYFCDVCRPINE